MLTPLRIVSMVLIYYQFPWPASIGLTCISDSECLITIGFPDSMNLLSLGIFASFPYTAYLLIKEILAILVWVYGQ